MERPHPNAEPCPRRGRLRADAVDAKAWTFLRDLLAKPGALQAEVERTLDAEVQADRPAEAVLSSIDAEFRSLDHARTRMIGLCRDNLITVRGRANGSTSGAPKRIHPGAAKRIQSRAAKRIQSEAAKRIQS